MAESQPAKPLAGQEAECAWSSYFGVVVTEASLLQAAEELSKVRDGFSSWVRPHRALTGAVQKVTPGTRLTGIEELRGDPIRVLGVGAQDETARVVLLLSKTGPYASLWHVGLNERELAYAEALVKKHLRSRRPALYWWLPPICTRVVRSWFGISAVAIVGTLGLLWLHLRLGWDKSLAALPGWLQTASYFIVPALFWRGLLAFIEFLFPPLQFVTGDEGKWLHGVRIGIRLLILGLILKEGIPLLLRR